MVSATGRWEPYEARVSRTVLRGPGGEIPPGYSLMPTATPFDDIRASWRTVRTMESAIAVNTGPVLFSFIPHSTGFARVPESLLLVFAVSVLESALLTLRELGRFTCKSKKLKGLMLASREHIPWQSFETIDHIRDRRNEVAHEATLVQPGECSNALAAIAGELLAWQVLDTDVLGQYSFTFAPSSQGSDAT